MSFAWPLALVALALVPALLAAYLWSLRRRRRYAVRHPDLALVRAALPPRARWRPHLPIALLLAGIAVLAVGIGRPQADVQVPSQRTAIILALDVSRSMCAADVTPNRLAAAQAAVIEFVKAQPTDTRMGLVVFSGFASLTVPPTIDRAALLGAVEGLSTGRGTAIGSALLTSLDAIAEINPQVAPVGAVPNLPQTDLRSGTPATPVVPAGPPKGATEGYVSDIVVLLTDGANTRGVTPLAAAGLAADRRVRVYPIGFGTTTPARMVCTTAQLGADAFGDTGGPFTGGARPDGTVPGGRNVLVVDEPTLQAVAATTGGSYHAAGDAAALGEVLRGIPREVVIQTEHRELTSWFAVFAAGLVIGALTLAVRWNPAA